MFVAVTYLSLGAVVAVAASGDCTPGRSIIAVTAPIIPGFIVGGPRARRRVNRIAGHPPDTPTDFDTVGLMRFDAVLFDIGGVLEVVEGMDFSSKYEDLLGLAAGTIAGHTADLWPAGALGLRTEDEIRREMSLRINLSAVVVVEIFEDMWAQYLGTADIELTNYLAGLRPRLRTGLLSNSFVGAREREEIAYGFSGLVDDIVYSHEVGIAKPDPEIYALACRRLDVDPTRTVFVDDAQIAVDGAAAVGMTTVLHHETHSTIAQLDTLLT